jgi:GrpB-like predicted nucleotidyltransferase (UPF0157 family)
MLIYRFDPEVSVTVSEFESQFRLASITGPRARVQVHVMHLPPGGGIGLHAAPLRRFFGVIAGSGWASGSQGARRGLAPGYGALWEEGELHEVGTVDGLTAISVEGNFEIWATEVTKDIVVADYDPEWPARFERISALVGPAVQGVAVRIDHVGSTSVPGLAAKPIIDMDVVVASEAGVRPAIDRLATVGYRWRGDLGIAGRQAFAYTGNQDLPAHHLYVVVENSKAHIDHWLLRDVLRDDPDARARYAELKQQNVETADGDMDVYVAAKASFVADLLRRARAERGLPEAEYWDPSS